MPFTESQLKEVEGRHETCKGVMEGVEHTTKRMTESSATRGRDADAFKKKLEALYRRIVEQKDYMDSLGRSLKMLEELLTRASAMSDADAARIFASKKFGPLVPYDGYKPAEAAKAQLVEAVEKAIENETGRGEHIADAQAELAKEWDELALKAATECEEIEKGTATVRSKFSGPGF